MFLRQWANKSVLTVAGATALFAGTLNPGTALAAQDPPPAQDNSAANKAPGKTADQQKNNKNDRNITKEIRKAVVADSNLSTYAHNVKIITRSGIVTLRGPVKTENEKAAIETKAKAVAGVNDVKNELTVLAQKG